MLLNILFCFQWKLYNNGGDCDCVSIYVEIYHNHIMLFSFDLRSSRKQEKNN